MITTCTMRLDGQRCSRPIDPSRYERGAWMCDACIARSMEQASHLPPSVVPAVADVYQMMQSDGIDQDEAVRRLGGLP